MPNLFHSNKDNITYDNAGMNQQSYNNPAFGAGQTGVTGNPVHHQQYDNPQAYANQDTNPMGSHHHHGGNPQHPGVTGTGVGSGTGTMAGLTHHNRHGEYPATDTIPADQAHNPVFSKPQPGVPDAHGTAANTTTGIHSSQVRTSTGQSPSTQATLGKLEHAAGSLLCSQTLKVKGDAKVAEAEAVGDQRAELRHAEAMEKNAQLARERANVHAARGNVHGSTHAAIGSLGTGTNPGTVGVPPGGQILR